MHPVQRSSEFRYGLPWDALFFLLALALLPVSVSALNPNLHISQYGHRTWRLQEGFLGGRPFAITQTVDGYLWVGTRAGLFRFDGVQFVPWHPPSGERLPSEQIWGLLGTRDGSLWIGTGAGPAKWNGQRLTRFPSVQGPVDHILEDPQGGVWVSR